MEWETKTVDGVLVVRLKGEIDLNTCDVLRSELDRLLKLHNSPHLVLNLGDVVFVDSSGLGVILGRYRQLTEANKRLAIVGLQPQVKRAFELSGLLRVIRLYASEDEAVAGVSKEVTA
ncbi:MAG: STAS domain-containing protein [Desulfotomaculales bacterium]